MVGEAEGQIGREKGRIANEEIHSSPPYESSNEEEVIKADEGKMGGKEEGCC
jgi:hypothetical protein